VSVLPLILRIANGSGESCKLFSREIASFDKGFGDLEVTRGLDRVSLAAKRRKISVDVVAHAAELFRNCC